MSDCYRDSSVMLHFAVSLNDTIDHVRGGHVWAALKTIADRRNLASAGAVLENSDVLSRLARLG